MKPTPTPTPTHLSPLSTLTSNLQTFVTWAIIVLAVCAVVIVALFILVPRARIRRYAAQAQLNEKEILRIRGELLGFVKDQSPTQGKAVSLGVFWRRKGTSKADRHWILADLRSRQIILPAYSQDKLEQFFQTLSWVLFANPPSYVKLSDRDWHQLANGAKTEVTIKTLIGNQTKIKKRKKTKTTIKNSPGSAVAVGTSNTAISQTRQIETLPTEQLVQLIEALRLDSGSLSGVEAEEAASTADALESDMNAGRESSAINKANALLDLISKATGAWTATTAVLKTIGAIP